MQKELTNIWQNVVKNKEEESNVKKTIINIDSEMRNKIPINTTTDIMY